MENYIIMALSAITLVCTVIVLFVFKRVLADMRATKDRVENVLKKHAEYKAAQPVPAYTQPVAAAPVQPEPVKEEAPVQPEPVKEGSKVVDGDAVSFSADGVKLTLEDKYLALSNESKKYYDEIVKCANGIENVKRFKNARYEEYKVGNSRIVRMLIKRETVVCEFILHNSDFKSYISENKVSIRPAPIVLKITSAEMLKTACDSIAIVVKQIETEKEAKRREMLERRRERRRAKSE